MFQPLVVWTSLAIPWSLPPVETYSVTRHKFYITAPVRHPMMRARQSTFSDRPVYNQDLIQEWNESLMYKGLDETIED